MRVKLDKGAYMPERAYTTDAGADLKTPYGFTLWHNEKKVIDTGVHIEIPAGFVGMVKSKSGLMCNCGITTDGTVDAGYTGSIRVWLKNNSHYAKVFKPGDKIAQLVILPIITPDFEQVDEITGGERQANGFGSTGK